MTKMRSLWSGELPLDEAFWTWAIGIGLLVNLPCSFAVSRAHHHRQAVGGAVRGLRLVGALQCSGRGRRLALGRALPRPGQPRRTCPHRHGDRDAAAVRDLSFTPAAIPRWTGQPAILGLRRFAAIERPRRRRSVAGAHANHAGRCQDEIVSVRHRAVRHRKGFTPPMAKSTCEKSQAAGFARAAEAHAGLRTGEMVFPDHPPTTWIKLKLSVALQATDCTGPSRRRSYAGGRSATVRQRQPRFFGKPPGIQSPPASPDITQ